MKPAAIIGIVLLALAGVLLFFGINATNSIGEKIVEGVTGKYTHNTMVYIVSGIVAGVAGIAALTIGRKA